MLSHSKNKMPCGVSNNITAQNTVQSSSKTCFPERNCMFWKWPLQFPDLNPIKHNWKRLSNVLKIASIPTGKNSSISSTINGWRFLHSSCEPGQLNALYSLPVRGSQPSTSTVCYFYGLVEINILLTEKQTEDFCAHHFLYFSDCFSVRSYLSGKNIVINSGHYLVSLVHT